MALANHPDRFPPEEKEERTKIFHDVGEAKSILTDQSKRRQYDNGADIQDINSGGGFPGGFGGGDMSDIFSMFMGSRGGGGGFHNMGGDEMPGFSFNMGGGGGGGKKKQKKFNF